MGTNIREKIGITKFFPDKMRFFSTLALLKQYNVLYMGGMREHINGLNCYHTIG